MDRYEKMAMKLPVVFDWVMYDGQQVFAGFNYEATKKAGRPMMDIHYCATKALNGIVERTVQYDKKRFSPAKFIL